jgi:hypothetical protein
VKSPVASIVIGLFTVLLSGITAPGVGAGALYDAADDFSASENPNGVWSYGFIPAPGPYTDLTLYDQPVQESGLDVWRHSVVQSLGAPSMAHNGTPDTINVLDLTIEPGELLIHPGEQGQEATVRFTAPSNEDLLVEAAFIVADPPGGCTTTVDVHVRKNGVSLFDGYVDGNVSAQDSEQLITIVSVAAGDVVDFVAGYGNGNFGCDNTQLEASLSTPPETDGDGVYDLYDNCPTVPNASGQSSDTDGDLAGNACDASGTGNVDCNQAINSVDALKVLRHGAGLSVAQSEPCLDLGLPLTSTFDHGDVDCDGSVNAVDALKILRAVAALTVSQEKGCGPVISL